MATNTLTYIIANDTELKAIAKEMLHKYKENLNLLEANATNQLRDTATAGVEADNDVITVFFELQSYWYYLENGAKPHFPPINAIEQWIKDKKIQLVPRGKQKKAPTARQVAFAICKSMEKGKRDIDGKMKAYISKPAIKYLLEDNYNLVEKFISRVSEIIAEQGQLMISSITEFTNS